MMFLILIEVFFFLLSGLALPFPVGLPPLPEDPALLRAAPADTVFYMQWYGAAEAAPQASNPAVRIASHPEVLAFVERVTAGISKMAQEDAGQEGGLQMGRLAEFGMGLIRRPGCLFMNRLTVEEVQRGTIDAVMGLVVRVGEDEPAARTAMADLTALVDGSRGGGDQFEGTIEVDGVTFTRFPTPTNGPPVLWGIVDGYLVVTLGEAGPAAITNNLRHNGGLEGRDLWKESRSLVTVARPTMRSFVDLAYMVEMVTNRRDLPEGQDGLWGLEQLRGFASESGLEGDEFVSRTALMTSERKGALALLDGGLLGAADLATLPGDADFALTTRLSPSVMLERILDILPAQDRNRTEQEMLEAVRNAAGLDLRKDILDHMGDRVSFWNSPSQGGALGTGLTLSWQLNDSAAFESSLEKLMEWAIKVQDATDRQGRQRRGTFVEATEVGDTSMWYLNVIGDDVPFAPAWCVTDGHLLVSLFPQMLRDTLATGLRTSKSLTYPDLLVAAEGARLVGYIDWERVMPQLYAVGLPLAQLAASELQREGFPITVADLPRLRAIAPHMSPGIWRLATTPKAMTLTSRGPIPRADPGVVLVLSSMMIIPYLIF